LPASKKSVVSSNQRLTKHTAYCALMASSYAQVFLQ